MSWNLIRSFPQDPEDPPELLLRTHAQPDDQVVDLCSNTMWHLHSLKLPYGAGWKDVSLVQVRVDLSKVQEVENVCTAAVNGGRDCACVASIGSVSCSVVGCAFSVTIYNVPACETFSFVASHPGAFREVGGATDTVF